MLLSELLKKIEVLNLVGSSDCEVRQIHFDSRKIEQGDLFVAVRGTQVDGHKFIDSVVVAGASVVICELLPQNLNEIVTYVVVPDASFALGLAANAFYGYPSERLILVGVTGTNGKTTTATLLYRLFNQLGHPTGLLSTIRNYAGAEVVPSTHTTGDALQIASLMARMVAAGCTHCFMEVTSHAVHQNRIAGLNFDGAVFTNLSHDHLDYHGTMEAYRDVKKGYFDNLLPSAFSLTNADDPTGTLMTADTLSHKFTYGSGSGVDFRLGDVGLDATGIEFMIAGQLVKSRQVGIFNAYNLAAAFGAAVLLGEDSGAVAGVLSSLEAVEGRMERIDGPDNLTAVVDFAHTPDALEKALATLRQFAAGRHLICIVGCGGERDKEKRPAMAAIAADCSDEAIFTSDNPRSEDPITILAEMEAGVPRELMARVQIILDRREAIMTACKTAPKGAIMLIAGKGHEKFQEIGGERLPFDDTQCASEAFKMRAGSKNGSDC